MNVQKVDNTQGNYLGSSEDWSNHIISMPCRLIALKGYESLVAAQTTTRITHRLFFQGHHDVRNGMRILQGQRVFEIFSVIEPSEVRGYKQAEIRETVSAS